MTAHEDLMRSLLVERYRPWRPTEEPDATPKQLARAMGQERRGRQRAAYRGQRAQAKTSEGSRTS